MNMSSNPPVTRPGQTLEDNANFWDLVNSDKPDFTQIKELINEAYVAETGESDATSKAVGSWLSMVLRNNSNLRRGISTDNTPLRWIIFPSLAVKFDYLIQRPCLMCLPYQSVNYI